MDEFIESIAVIKQTTNGVNSDTEPETDGQNCEHNCNQKTTEDQKMSADQVIESTGEGKGTEEKINDSKEQTEKTEKISAENKLTEKWLKFGDFTLSEFDKQVIQCPKEWLTDTIMNAAQHLLETQFPHIKSLQNVLLNQIDEFVALDKGQYFVQIVNDGGEHWLVLSNARAKDRERQCKLYDSKAYFELGYGPDVQNAILTLMSTSEQIFVDIEYVSQQIDANQCGLYAIAFAQALCSGEDPSHILFSNSAEKLRKHLLECFERAEITRFLTGAQTILDEFVVS